LVSKVNFSQPADFGVHRDCSVVEVAPVARLKAVFNSQLL